MNSINASMGFFSFQLHIGRSLRLIPPLTASVSDPFNIAPAEHRARELLKQLQSDVATAHDNLTAAKINQTLAVNARRGTEIIYQLGNNVLLSTMHRRYNYMRKGDKWAVKFLV